MKLATFQAPGSGRSTGRGGRGRPGRRVRDGPDRRRCAGGASQPRVADGPWPLDRGRAARAGPGARARSTRSASTTPSTSTRPARSSPSSRSCSSRSAARSRRPAVRSAAPTVVRRLDYEGELTIVIGADGADRRLLHRRRRHRARPPGPRAAVDPGQGRRHVLPVRPVDHDRRRGP